MNKFFFTYGSGEEYPFVGGWTEIIAPDMKTACDAFRIFHPDKISGFLNCASVYPEEAFLNTSMSGPNGNFGRYCHEVITINRILT